MIAINDSNGADQPTGKKISLNLLDKQPAGEESTGGSCGSGGSCGCGPTEEQAPQVGSAQYADLRG
jgi:hypothetical protein